VGKDVLTNIAEWRTTINAELAEREEKARMNLGDVVDESGAV